MKRLSKMNGWQRLWFAATVLALVISSVVYPIVVGATTLDSEFKRAVRNDYSNPKCTPFFTQAPNQLLQPLFLNYGGNCFHIYNSRESNNWIPAPPTYKEWSSQEDTRHWANVARGGIIIALLVLFGSAIVYALGAIGAWIIKGFRPPNIAE